MPVSDWAGPGRSPGAGGPGVLRASTLLGASTRVDVSVGLCEEWHVAAVGTLGKHRLRL